MSARDSGTHDDDPSIARALDELYAVISFEEGEDPIGTGCARCSRRTRASPASRRKAPTTWIGTASWR
jgi:hypothetical protein